MRLLPLPGVIALAAWAGSAAPAHANHYHTACVGHGFVHGAYYTDGAMHSRIEAGCSNPGLKRCRFYTLGGWSPAETVAAGVNSTCDYFISSTDGIDECSSQANVYFENVFEAHHHDAHSPPC
jgi:hypothetical protein